MSYRINGFEQLKQFYSWVFNNADKDVKPYHVSLYVFLLNQNNRANWVEWFKCPYDLGMQGALIGSRSTYYKAIHDLEDWGLIHYRAGINSLKAPIISLVKLSKNEQLPEQVPVPLPEQLPAQVPEQLPAHIYITSNGKRITGNSETIDDFSSRWVEPEDATTEQKELTLAVRIYKAYCDIYGKRAYKDIPSIEWIEKVRKIPADEPEKIPDVLYYAKKFNTFGFERAASLDYLVSDWVTFRAGAERAYLNSKK